MFISNSSFPLRPWRPLIHCPLIRSQSAQLSLIIAQSPSAALLWPDLVCPGPLAHIYHTAAHFGQRSSPLSATYWPGPGPGWPAAHPTSALATLLACSLLALLSYQHTPVWRNALTLWQNAAQRAPLMPEAHYNLGHAHHLVGNLDPARHAYERAIELSPRYVLALAELGAIAVLLDS